MTTSENVNSPSASAITSSLYSVVPEHAQRLDPNSIKVSRVFAAIFSLAIVVIGLVISIINNYYWILLVFTVIALIIFTLSYYLAAVSYRHTWWWFAEEGLYIQQGILWRKKTLIPQNRVQHTDVSQGPLQRKYSIGKLIIHTAGTRDASVPLYGLSHQVALELRAQLVEQGEHDAV